MDFILRKDQQILSSGIYNDLENILNLKSLSYEISEVLFLGNSISKTDWWFYKDLFKEIKKLTPHPKFVIFFHSKEEREEKLMQLMKLNKEYFIFLNKKNLIEWVDYEDVDTTLEERELKTQVLKSNAEIK